MVSALLGRRSRRSSISAYTRLIILAILSTTIFPASSALAQQKKIEGEFLVRFNQNVSADGRSYMRSTLGVERAKSFKTSGAELVRTQTQGKLNDAYAKELLASGLVDYIEPNYVISLNAMPNDSDFSELWGMHNTGQTGGTSDVDIDAPEAWDLSTGSEEVVIGIVDTGVNYRHADLNANMWVNPDEIAGNGLDDDGNGYIDDVYGYNSVSDSGDPMDDHGHGSHCAGTIGGTGNNSQGVAGVNWNVKLMGLKFLSASGSGSTAGAIAAIEYAINMKRRGVNLKVLSNSWGGGGFSQALYDVIDRANDAGILFVAAAGNSSNDNDGNGNYPSNYDIENVLAVAAIDHDGNLASFSNYGATTVDIAAPGVDIVSTMLDSSYAALSGTSMATPHVAGVAGLLAAHDSDLSAAQLKSRIINTVKPLESLEGLVRAPGTVSASNALTNTVNPNPPVTSLKSYEKSPAFYRHDSDLGSNVLKVDDGYTKVALGFNFPFYDSEFTHLAISSNGRVIPMNEEDTTPSSADYSNSVKEGIMVYHDDLYPASDEIASGLGGVWYKSDSSSATITWYATNYGLRQSSDRGVLLVFQAKLSADGGIEFQYTNTNVNSESLNYGASASVGIAPANGARGIKLQVSHNTANESELGVEKAMQFSSQAKGIHDVDGDGVSDLMVWRPHSGEWFILTSSSGYDFDSHLRYQWGLPGDIPVPGDYDGDSLMDLAVWRPSDGYWFIKTSSSNYTAYTATQWGLNGDIPTAKDYDGDGRTDMTVYRPDTGTWYTLSSSSNFNRTAALSGDENAVRVIAHGGNEYTPVPGDFNNDGTDDYAVVWNIGMVWSVVDIFGQLLMSAPWGLGNDQALSCPWTGGAASRVIVREEGDSKAWFIANADGTVDTFTLGQPGDKVGCVLNPEGGDTPNAIAWNEASGTWTIRQADGTTEEIQFGLPGDIPILQ